MANTYCPECGKKHFYTLKRPEKCEGCGTSFTLAKCQTDKQPQKVIQSSFVKSKPNPEVVKDDDSSDVLKVPKIQNLDYELDYGNISNVIKGKDIIGEIKEGIEETKSTKRKWKRKATKNSKNK